MKKRTKKKHAAAKPEAPGSRAPKPSLSASGYFSIPKLLDTIIEYGPLFLLGVSPLVFWGDAGEFENVPKMAFLQCGILVLALLRTWHVSKERPFVWKRTPLDIPLILFYAFCWISLIKAPNVYLAIPHLLHYGASIIFFFFLLNTIRDSKSIDAYFFTSTVSVMAISIVGILQYLFNISWVPQIVPPSSTFANKNMATHFTSMAIPLCVGSMVLAKRLWVRCLSILSLFTTLLYLLYTKTRAGWLAALVVLLLIAITYAPRLYASMRARLNKHLIINASIALCGVMFLIILAQRPAANIPVPMNTESIGKRFLSIADLHEGDSSQLRIIWWENTLKMAQDHFWLGVGMQNFKIFYPLYHRAVALDWSFTDEHQLTRVHNDYLQLLVELGIFGFSAYAWMFLAFFWMFWKLFWKSRDQQLSARAFFICLGVVGFCINASFCFPMERAIPTVYLFTLFALMTVLYGSSAQRTPSVWKFRYPLQIRIFLSVLLIASLISSVYVIRKVILSDRYFVEAIKQDQAGSLEGSNEALKKAKIFSMYNSNISALLARNYTIQKNYRMAIDEYRETFRVHPYNTSAILNTGYCYLQLKNYAEAERYFKWAIKIMPDFEQAHNDLGIVYYAQNDYAKAAVQYQKSIEINKGYAEPHINLGNIYRTQKKFSEAIKEYATALEIKPGLAETRQMLSGLYMETGQYEKANEVLKPLLQKRPDAAESYVLQGNIYQRQGQHEKSLQEYLNALALKPNSPLIYHNLGLAQYYLKNYAQAEAYFKKALDLDPRIAETHNMLGQLCLMKQDDPGALGYFQKALQVNPQLKDAQFNIGTISLRLGQYDLAIKAYQETLRIDPNYSLAHYNLGTLYMARGENQKALFHFEQALKNPSPLIDIKTANEFIKNLKNKLGQPSP